MAPSEESQALGNLFKQISANWPSGEDEGSRFVGRALYDQVHSVASEATGVGIENVIVEGRGLTVPCKRFTPQTIAKKRVILFCHGGGYNFGSANGHRKLAAHLARSSQVIVLSVDYRLAPENKYPAALEDCLAAYDHLLKKEKYTPANIVIAGDSVGGGLSAILPLAIIKAKLPSPVGSIALSPAYDQTTWTGGTLESNKDKDFLSSVPFMQKLIQNYVEGSGVGYDDPMISPLLASDEDLAKLPPTWISVAGDDMLRDQGEKFAARLEKVGVPVVLEVHEGQQHVMEFMAGRAPEAIESLKKIGSWVRNLKKAEGGSSLREAVGTVDM